MVFKNLVYRSSHLDAPFVSGAKLKALRFVPLRREGTQPLSDSLQCMSNVGHRSGQASNDQGRVLDLPDESERISSRNRCIIVVGASAGGVEALKRLATYLPPDLTAAVFVVLHVGQTSYLPEILDRTGPLRATKAKSGEQFERGRVYVAPPGFHL